MQKGLSWVDGSAFDVIIIGGGITGTGVARDCALRGLKVALVEKDDFASGTTGTCMGLLHGGPRYLLTNPELTRISCEESGHIQRIAPHLCFSVPFLQVLSSPEQMEVFDKFLGVYDQYQHLKNGKPHIRFEGQEMHRLEPSLAPGPYGGITLDEWGVNVFRLNLLNAKSASAHGARITNHAEVTQILKENGRVVGVEVKDLYSLTKERLYGRLVVNASGPWVPKIAKMAGTDFKLRPSKGVHVFLDRRITSVGLSVMAVDGRNIELLPHENTTMIGCTDTDFYGDPIEARPTFEEIEYLLEPFATLVPQLRQARVIRSMAGVRPLLYETGMVAEKVTRDHRVRDHEEDGVPGFITIGGGKMVIHRLMAEDTTNLICKKLGIEASCKTREIPLPGGERLLTKEEIKEMARRYGIRVAAVNRLVSRHGTLASYILETYGNGATRRSEVCTCEPVLEAEIRYVIHEEWARSLDDIRRRTRMGMGPCQGCGCIGKVAAILGEELGLSAEEVALERHRFLAERWKGKRALLDCKQAAQEEITFMVYFAGKKDLAAPLEVWDEPWASRSTQVTNQPEAGDGRAEQPN